MGFRPSSRIPVLLKHLHKIAVSRDPNSKLLHSRGQRHTRKFVLNSTSGLFALLWLPFSAAFVSHARPVGWHGRLAFCMPTLVSICGSSASSSERYTSPGKAHASVRIMGSLSSTTDEDESKSMKLTNLKDFAARIDNSLIRELVREDTTLPPNKSREVRRAHYTIVKTKPVVRPYLVCYSKDCAELIGLQPEECLTEDFAAVFGGNKALEGMDQQWATVYGCHHYGHWFGQLGDGRAISIGEVVNARGERLELQLKGAGPTPYSRTFDGRAVLRSSIREFLASEALHHLGVPGTRALCVVGTSEWVMRAWYSDTAEARSTSDVNSPLSKAIYPPSKPTTEPGAVMCRVAPSFLRFAHLELFWRREEYEQMVQMADHVIRREYPDLLALGLTKLELYVELFEQITKRLALLIAEWMRVGYVQGNMNSDNTALGGFTIDFGPFGMVEEYTPLWTPFTSDQERKFSFTQQPQAGQVNIVVLCEAFKAMVEHVAGGAEEASKYVEKLDLIASDKYSEFFSQAYREHCRNKLGLADQAASIAVWQMLMKCMAQSKVDWTLFFRLLSDASESDLFRSVSAAFYEEPETDVQNEWRDWFKMYKERVELDGEDAAQRVERMKRANPKYIMRNWMMTMAYEGAEKGEYAILNELARVMRDPYGEQTVEMQEKYFQKTPPWARMMPGVAFMS